jgi:hypothetical protein
VISDEERKRERDWHQMANATYWEWVSYDCPHCVQGKVQVHPWGDPEDFEDCEECDGAGTIYVEEEVEEVRLQ